MSAFTAKTYLYGKAPKRITLKGDKTKKSESAQHIIEFPGGAIELTRTTDGHYWAHIMVHKSQVIEDADGLTSANGRIIGSRIDGEQRLDELTDLDNIQHLAVLIKTEAP